MAENIGRKRVYMGDEKERHKQAVKKYLKRMKEEADEIGVPLRRHLQKNKKQLNVYLENDLYDKLKSEAEQKNMSLTELVSKKLRR